MTMVSAPEKLIGLDRPHAQQEFAIVLGSVGSRMNSPMTVRTERNHKARVVRSAVGEPTDVVGLEIGHSVCAKERRRLAATFTVSVGTGDDIVANVPAAFKYGSGRHRLAGSSIGSGESTFSQVSEVVSGRKDAVDDGSNVINGAKLKNESVAHVPSSIGRAACLVAFADHLALEFHAVRQDLEEQNALATDGMFRNGSVALLHNHVADLAFSKILEDAVVAQSVAITVRLAFLAGENDDYGMLCGGDDATALLTVKPAMYICPAIVDPATLKTPGHCSPLHSINRVLASSGCARVKTARAAA